MKPASKDIKQNLTDLQFKVTQEDGTEPPFQNAYWDNKKEGLYVDIVSGEPLFSSKDKFDSGTGWPSFTKPVDAGNIVEKSDFKLFMKRTEVRSKSGDSHLGHVFSDGPAPSGLRYCINSASLRFIPVDQLEKEGYGEFKSLFVSQKAQSPNPKKSTMEKTVSPQTQKKDSSQDERPTLKIETAILAGGCFWGMEDLLRKLPGVVDTQVGYTGGEMKNPGYENVKTGTTGHAESVQIRFDPSKTSFEKIVEYFFKIHDPTTSNQQGNDVGTQYRSAIFVLDETQEKIAKQALKKVEASGKWKKNIVTKIEKATAFYDAEEYHQDYLEKFPNGYTCHFERDISF